MFVSCLLALSPMNEGEKSTVSLLNCDVKSYVGEHMIQFVSGHIYSKQSNEIFCSHCFAFSCSPTQNLITN